MPGRKTQFIPTTSYAARHHELDLAEERTFGYIDLEEWNQLPPADQARMRNHSVNLFKAFRPTKYLLHGLGLFPFSAKKLEDGSYSFNLHHYGFYYIVFVITTFIVFIVFVLFSLGFILIFVEGNPGLQVHDRCGNTWGKTVISRNLPAIVFIWSNLTVATAGSLYILFHGASFLGFYNVVNEAVMQLDCEATPGILKTELRSAILFVVVFLYYTIAFSLGSNYSLEEITAFFSQCIFYFYDPDLYKNGADKVFDAIDYEELHRKCERECKDCFGSEPDEQGCSNNKCYNHINTPTDEFRAFKWVGFFLIIYIFLAARAIIHQFEFSCQVLVNVASVWNKRFLNYASKDNSIRMDDQYRRRIKDQDVLKDHFQIVKLYDVAEENFSTILFVYYACVFFSLIVEMYYCALLSTQVTCSTAVERERKAALAGLCYENSTENIHNSVDVLRHGLNNSIEIVSFEDACSVKPNDIIVQASLTNLVLLVITMGTFVNTTTLADRASHQADIGFYRVRRKGYLSCRTKKERNLMHALVFSFTGPKPFAITAARYFLVRKKTIIVLTSVAFIYFLIILGFKPGMVSSGVRCYNLTSAHPEPIFIVKYPKVIR